LKRKDKNDKGWNIKKVTGNLEAAPSIAYATSYREPFEDGTGNLVVCFDRDRDLVWGNFIPLRLEKIPEAPANESEFHYIDPKNERKNNESTYDTFTLELDDVTTSFKLAVGSNGQIRWFRVWLDYRPPHVHSLHHFVRKKQDGEYESIARGMKTLISVENAFALSGATIDEDKRRIISEITKITKYKAGDVTGRIWIPIPAATSQNKIDRVERPTESRNNPATSPPRIDTAKASSQTKRRRRNPDNKIGGGPGYPLRTQGVSRVLAGGRAAVTLATYILQGLVNSKEEHEQNTDHNCVDWYANLTQTERRGLFEKHGNIHA